MPSLTTLLLLLLTAGLSAQEPVITELMARNTRTLADGDGDFSDWLEVHNPILTPIQLGGYYLTDDANNLTKWQFPATTLQPGSYLVVFASKKNRAISGSQLHTNFNLDGRGEYLALVKPDGITVASEFSPGFPEQRTAYSYGRVGVQLLYFPTPTPGAINNNGFTGFVCKSEIQTKRGILTGPTAVAITCSTPTASIYYTLDGSKPTQASTPYTTPILITTTSVVRAGGFASGLAPSPIDTHTFVFVDNTVQQPTIPQGFPSSWGGGAPSADYEMDPRVVNDPLYQQSVKDGLRSLPTLSLALPISSLFGPTGIYDNPTRSGASWERETSAEYFDPATGQSFQIEAGLRIQGSASRNPGSCPKHSLSLRFRDAYEGDLDYPVFAKSSVQRFDTLQLRGVYNNAWTHRNSSQRNQAMYIRDQYCRDALIDMGQKDGQHGSYVCVYFNGVFWGIYNLHERAEANHYAAYNGGSRDDYDARNGSGMVNGNSSAWNAMRSAVAALNWPLIQQVLDVDNYIDWMIVNEFGGNQDWKDNGNWRAAGGGTGQAPWRFYSWDAERTLENPSQTGTRPSLDPSDLLRHLVNIPDFVSLFGDRLHRHFYNNGALTPARAADRFTQRANELDTAIVCESARWGDYRASTPYTRNGHWIPELNRLRNSYFPVRSSRVLSRYKSRGLYPALNAPTFTPHGGKINRGYALPMQAAGQIYYTLDGSDPRDPGGAIATSAKLYTTPVSLLLSTDLKARTFNGGQWSALNEARFLVESISINEVLAKNTTGLKDNYGEFEDWIELHNKNTLPVRIGGMYLTDSESKPTRWQIPRIYILNPGKTFLIWADDDTSQTSLVDLHANFKLSSAGEEVLLYDSDGVTLIDRLSFGAQLADTSTGRLHDGHPGLVTFPDPSPNQANDIPICGSRRFSSLDPTTQTQSLTLLGTPGLGKPITLRNDGIVATGSCALLVSGAADEVDLGGLSVAQLLVAQPAFVGATRPIGSGGLTDFPMTVPTQSSLIGSSLYLQAWTIAQGALDGSTGLHIKICQ